MIVLLGLIVQGLLFFGAVALFDYVRYQWRLRGYSPEEKQYIRRTRPWASDW